jgi:hypothetical protein
MDIPYGKPTQSEPMHRRFTDESMQGQLGGMTENADLTEFLKEGDVFG